MFMYGDIVYYENQQVMVYGCTDEDEYVIGAVDGSQSWWKIVAADAVSQWPTKR